MSFFSFASTSNEHKMIDVQYDIEKLQADLEFHQQKIRLINVELEKKQLFSHRMRALNDLIAQL